VKVAAHHAPLLPSGSLEAIDLIRKRVERCEAQSVAILCCPEAVLTTVVGFTEVTGSGTLHNSAAVYHRGSVIGLYRTLYRPSIDRSASLAIRCRCSR
jgi:predicted amidohydrolase